MNATPEFRNEAEAIAASQIILEADALKGDKLPGEIKPEDLVEGEEIFVQSADLVH